MKNSILIFFSIYFICCSKPPKAKYAGIRVNYDTVREPILRLVHDSFKPYIPFFKKILTDDQFYRGSKDDEYYRQNYQYQNYLDSINEIKVIDFIRKYGFQGPNQIGHLGYLALTNTIQHSSLETKIKMYPVFVNAYFNQKLYGYQLARLEDRINERNMRKQYFGTQMFYDDETKSWKPFPIYNIDSVNFFRNELCITTTFEVDLLESFNYKFEKNQYLNELPKVMKKLNFTDKESVHYNKPFPSFIIIDSSFLK